MNKHSASRELLHLFLEWLMGTAGVLGSLFCLITASRLSVSPLNLPGMARTVTPSSRTGTP